MGIVTIPVTSCHLEILRNNLKSSYIFLIVSLIIINVETSYAANVV